jgi:hypothetical protein
VPQSQHKPLQTTPKLPNPELNPLLNPTLGNNLGRWAQAYFTSPPEKREEAVLELLHELEAEAGSNGSTLSETGNTPPWLHSMESDQLNPALTCAECGHQNAPQQRFCGMCGSRLVFSDSPSDSSVQTATQPVRQTQEVSPLPISSPDPVPSFGSLSLFATAPTNKDTEVQWLQEQTYDSDLDDGSQRSSATKYLVTALGLMLLGVLFYAQWKPQKSHQVAANSATAHPAAVNQPTESHTPEKAATQPAAEPAANQAAPANEAASKQSSQAPEREAASHELNPHADNPPPAVQTTEPAPVRNASTVQSEAAAPESSAAGAAELAQAEGYLTGKYGSRNSSEAARYLWKAVSKENPTAIMLLSDLYLAGDGVPKSCAQAQLLLRAAARKNVAAAANKLRELQQTGCP